MDKTLKRKWIKALRSGKYRQGQGELYSKGKYCCLGVLARIQGCSTTKLLHHDDMTKPPVGFGGRLGSNTRDTLIEMNDGRMYRDPNTGALTDGIDKKSFKEIAAFIEANL